MFGLTVGFAEVTVDVSGSADATFGYDLDHGYGGFENSEDVSFVVTIIPEQTVASDEASGWTGYIEFADFSVIYDPDSDSDYYKNDLVFIWEDADGDGEFDPAIDYWMGNPETGSTAEDYIEEEKEFLITEPSVSAKIMNGPMYIKIYGGPEFEPDYVEAVEDDSDIFKGAPEDVAESGDEMAEDDESDYIAPTLEGAGITLGYDSDNIDVEVYVADNNAYDSSDPEAWFIGGSVSLAGAGANVSVGVGKQLSPKAGLVEPLYFGAMADYTLDLGMGSLVPSVGVDYWMDDVGATGIWELGAGLDLTFTNEASVAVDLYMSDIDEDVDFEATITEDGEAGFVPALGAEIFFGGYDTFDDYRLAIDVSYMVGDFKPFAGLDYTDYTDQQTDANPVTLETDTAIGANAGIEFTGIPMTTITLEWSSSDLGNDVLGVVELTAEVAM